MSDDPLRHRAACTRPMRPASAVAEVDRDGVRPHRRRPTIPASSSISPTQADLLARPKRSARSTRWQSRSGACPSRSRTTSTSPACRPRPPAPNYAYWPERDATVVARLKAAGALVVGKTNLDQFATGLVGVRTPYPIPRNAIDPELVPGGSSLGLGRGDGARHRLLRARHRHGRLRPHSGRPQQHRRAEADRRRAVGQPASCRPAARSTASRSSR